ncbi:hypothetical protein Mapa_009543 [Marchantia paleacea]|nr:hypothetical protein Mapa_009543 [Marchantia paleacea]
MSKSGLRIEGFRRWWYELDSTSIQQLDKNEIANSEQYRNRTSYQRCLFAPLHLRSSSGLFVHYRLTLFCSAGACSILRRCINSRGILVIASRFLLVHRSSDRSRFLRP